MPDKDSRYEINDQNMTGRSEDGTHHVDGNTIAGKDAQINVDEHEANKDISSLSTSELEEQREKSVAEAKAKMQQADAQAENLKDATENANAEKQAAKLQAQNNGVLSPAEAMELVKAQKEAEATQRKTEREAWALKGEYAAVSIGYEFSKLGVSAEQFGMDMDKSVFGNIGAIVAGGALGSAAFDSKNRDALVKMGECIVNLQNHNEVDADVESKEVDSYEIAEAVANAENATPDAPDKKIIIENEKPVSSVEQDILNGNKDQDQIVNEATQEAESAVQNQQYGNNGREAQEENSGVEFEDVTSDEAVVEPKADLGSDNARSEQIARNTQKVASNDMDFGG